MLSQFFKSLVQPKTVTQSVVAVLVLWNPVVSAALSLVFGGLDDYWRNWFVSWCIGNAVALQCIGGSSLIAWLDRALAALRGRPVPMRTVGWRFAVSTLVMPFALPFGFRFAGWMSHLASLEWSPPTWGAYRRGFAFGLIFAALFFLRRSRLDAQEAAREADDRLRKLENEQLRAKVAALTAEMNPHLLFNALNTVASLVHEHPDAAEEVTLKLADLYRQMLQVAHRETHSLEQEIALCESYLAVERARFRDRLAYRIDVHGSVDPKTTVIPVLLLQPFVENAVVHGISAKKGSGNISLTVSNSSERLEIAIEDDGVGLGQSTRLGNGRALRNCTERLTLMYGTSASLVVEPGSFSGTRVLISIPMSLHDDANPSG